MQADHVILYDRDCGFCKWSLDKLLRWDRAGRLRPVAIQSDEGERLLSGMSREAMLDSWHFVEPDGTVTSAGRLLRNGAAELQRLAALLAAARGKRHDDAQERYDSDFLGTHDCTSRLQSLTGAIVRTWRERPTAEWRAASQSC